jgi:hypothetical protein
MLYYHIYKTGGSTTSGVMSDIVKTDLVQGGESKFFFRRLRKGISWNGHAVPAIHMASTKNVTVMYEMHVEFPAPNYPTLVELVPFIDRWRSVAQKRDVPFFAFTTIREPVGHALSFFNFFHVAGKDQRWNPFKGYLQPTETNFLHTFQGNRQCLLLDKDAEGIFLSPKIGTRYPEEVSYMRRRRRQFEDNDDEKSFYKNCRIDLVWDALFGTLDWVGITEDLQQSTLPLLTTILLNDTEIGRNWTSRKVFIDYNKTKHRTPLNISDLSESTLSRVNQETQLDQQLYEEIKRTYHFSSS